MNEEAARNLIERELVEKMLGPGYAKDLIQCADDASDEIIPDNPYYAYSLGVLAPDGEAQENDEEAEIENPNFDAQDDINDEEAEIPGDDDIVEIPSDGDSNEEEEMRQNINMNSHIGLITCISQETQEIDVKISYGTYRKLTREESINEVRVLTGIYGDNIGNVINEFANNGTIIDQLPEGVAFNDLFNVDQEAGTIALSENFNLNQLLRIPKDAYPIEANMINLLLGPHYKRTNHEHIFTLTLNEDQGVVQDNTGSTTLYWNKYNSRGRKFIKILLQATGEHPVYQPKIEVTAPHGNIESYIDPITNLDDIENNINEFVYRNVANYGKGVNCALEWDENGTRVFTTFTPKVDINRFSNEISEEYNNDAIDAACILRNLSIWSELNNDAIIDILRQFVDGYKNWHNAQQNIANNIDQYENEKTQILEHQHNLLKRLRNNVEYLKNNEEALECFKIANTAMLLQMVVAKHTSFRKNRDAQNYDEEPDIYNRLDYFTNAEYTDEIGEPKYRPFQLAFLLMNVRSTFDNTDQYHNDIVDLIWFPTGGGKTEAYLALTALTIVHRRRRGQDQGISVIMRYTLRMLTTQQFERASYLICALEFLRNQMPALNLGNEKITIGIYVGSGVTPNRVRELHEGNNRYAHFFNNPGNGINNNPFPISYCPWCGSRLVAVAPDGINHGYKNNGNICCINAQCAYNDYYYNNNIPLYYIDEQIYNNRPTLLFATVDKFAQLYRRNGLLNPNGIDAPDLIVQDELHLLVGALGSIVGLFESVVEALISNNNRRPKIIASTATTRNTSNLIRGLFNREVSIFPPQGINYNDNYFSHIEANPLRRHIGIMPSMNTNSNVTEIRITALLLLSRAKLIKQAVEDAGGDWRNAEDISEVCINNNGVMTQLLDNYWTSVMYYNSLKDLGRSRSRVAQEVFENFRAHKYLYQIPQSMDFVQRSFDQRLLEFTSRIESSRIREFLTRAETPMNLQMHDNQIRIESGYDLIFASNMISVGIDISRWNLMVMVGQPRSTSEYVQSSSRVGRNTYGLVINLLNPQRVREHSLFENYKSFHSTYYKSVEPLSITPLTSSTIKHKILNNMMSIYMRFILEDPDIEEDELADNMINDIFIGRFNPDDRLINILNAEIINRHGEIQNINNPQNFAQSLRDIMNDAYANISQIDY